MLLAAGDSKRQGFMRIINETSHEGTVSALAFDDEGRQYGPVTFDLAPQQAKHFNSDDLENGNADKGLRGRLGSGRGDWRMQLTADMDVQALAYVRIADGFLAGMNGLAPQAYDERHEVVFFNS